MSWSVPVQELKLHNLLEALYYYFLFFKRQPHTKQKKVNTAGRVGPKETDYSA